MACCHHQLRQKTMAHHAHHFDGIDRAVSVFHAQSMLLQRLVDVNSVIRCCARHGQLTKALQLFQQLLEEGILPNKLTFLSIVSALAAAQATLRGIKWMQTYIIACSFELDIMVGTCLIHMCGKCHCLDYARRLFEMMPVKNTVTWNAMITAFAQNWKHEAALLLYAEMASHGVPPSEITYILIVNICTSTRDLALGTRMHACIVASGYAADLVVQCALVTIYGKCGSLEKAEKCFSQISVPNVVAWTAMITAYSENGKSEEAFGCLFQMQGQEIALNAVTFIVLVDVCARKPDFKMGLQLHSQILASGYDGTIQINNALIFFYGSCGCVEECQMLFDGMQTKDVISWNGMMTAYGCSGHSLEALMLFLGLCESGITPTKATFLNIFGVCANLGMVSEVYALHAYALYGNMLSNGQLENGLISLYGSCNSFPDALIMFHKATKSDIVTWNALLGAHLQHEDGDGVRTLFYQMLVEGVLPNNVTMITLYSACACHSWLLNEGMYLHASWSVVGRKSYDMALNNALLNMYAKHGRLLDVHTCFSSLSEYNTISFNLEISVYADLHQTEHVVHLFYEMLLKGLMPDEGSFVLFFNAFASEGSLTEVHRMQVCSLSQKQYRRNPILQNAIMDAYGKCQHLEGAQEVFDELLHRDVVAYNTLMAAFADSRSPPLLFNCMLQEGIMPDDVTYINLATSCASHVSVVLSSHLYARLACYFQTFYNVVLSTALVKMRGSCGQLDKAIFTFKAIHKWNVFAWNTMLRVYSHYGRVKETLKLIQQMQCYGSSPDKITFVAVLSTCAHEGLVTESLNMLAVILFYCTSELIEEHYTCLVDGLGRSGQLDGAEVVLKAMFLQVPFSAAMAYLSCCKIHADAERAVKFYEWLFEQEDCSAEALFA